MSENKKHQILIPESKLSDIRKARADGHFRGKVIICECGGDKVKIICEIEADLAQITFEYDN